VQNNIKKRIQSRTGLINNRLSKILFVLFIAFIVVVLSGVIVTFLSKGSTTEWVWYKNKEVGFKIAYPKDWQEPQFSASKGDQGVSYTFNFKPGPRYSDGDFSAVSRRTIFIRLDSDNFSTIGEFNRKIGPFVTKTAIEQMLSSINNGGEMQWGDLENSTTTIVYHNKIAYVSLLDNIHPGATNQLAAYQIVSLSKLNVNAAYAHYEILGRPNYCNKSELSSNDKEWCLTQKTKDTLLRVLSSIQEL
jgi:hypothetical protein